MRIALLLFSIIFGVLGYLIRVRSPIEVESMKKKFTEESSEKYCKEADLSYFIISLGCLIPALAWTPLGLGLGMFFCGIGTERVIIGMKNLELKLPYKAMEKPTDKILFSQKSEADSQYSERLDMLKDDPVKRPDSGSLSFHEPPKQETTKFDEILGGMSR